MPQYFTGANPENAFAAGLMAGYDFVDRIQARREQLRLQRRAEARDDQRFEMDKEAFATNQEATKLNMRLATSQDARAATAAEQQTDTFNYNKGLRPVLEQRAEAAEKRAQQEAEESKQTSDINQEAGLLGIQTIREQKQFEKALAGAISRASGASPLTQVGMQGVGQPWDPPGATQDAPGAASPSATPPAAEPSIWEPRYKVGETPPPAPLNLKDAQAKADKRPGPIARAVDSTVTALGAPGAAAVRVLADRNRRAPQEENNEFFSSVVDVDNVSGNAPAGYMITRAGREVSLRDVRNNFEQYADQYLPARKDVNPQAREVLDANLQAGLAARKETLTAELGKIAPTDKLAGSKRAFVQRQLAEVAVNEQKLIKAKAETLAEEALVRERERVIAMSDPRVSQVVAKAAELRDTGTPLIRSATESAADSRRLAKINPKGVSQADLEVLARGVVAGKVTPEAFENIKRYGSFVAPEQPKYINMSSGVVLAVYPNGAREFIYDTRTNTKKTADQLKAEAAISAGVVNALNDDMKGRIAQGLIPGAQKGSEAYWTTRTIETLRSNASKFQQDTGIRVLDASGDMDYSELTDPAKRATLSRWVTDVENKVKNRGDTVDPIDREGRAGELIPQAPRRLSYGTVIGGYQYVGPEGGEGYDKSEWLPVE